MPANVETMFSASNITPWHGLGHVVNEVDSIEDAIELAGLGWGVDLAPMYVQQNGEYTKVQEAQAVVRDTDQSILGVVGPRYTPVQNKDKFSFFQDYLDAGEAGLETAGSLQNGRKTWILAKLNRNNAKIAKGDEVAKYLLLSDSYDGTMAVRVGFTPIRVVCVNTLAMAHSKHNAANKLIRVRHNKNVKANLDDIKEIVNLADEQFEATADQYRFLAKKGCNFNDLKKYIKVLFKIDEKEKQHKDAKRKNGRALSQKTLNTLDQLYNCYQGGLGQDLESIQGSWWQSYNMVSDFLTHEQGRSQENRLNNLWFGPSVKLNQDAFDLAMQMAETAPAR